MFTNQETINLLVGAAISLFASLITIIVTSVIQQARDHRARRQQVLLERINLLEDFAKQMVMHMSQVSMGFEADFDSKDDFQKISYLQKLHEKREPFVMQLGYFVAISQYLGGNTNRLFQELLNVFEQESIFIGGALDALNDKNAPPANCEEIYRNFNYLECYLELLSSFDKLKTKS